MSTQQEKKQHWENIYQSKSPQQTGWYQEKPESSLDFIKKLQLNKSAKIIDVGGGESNLVDYLLDAGFEDITVLDISKVAIEKKKESLGRKASLVKWLVEDVEAFTPSESYDLRHDRACFHFIRDEKRIQNYIGAAQNGINKNGHLIIGTFSKEGPLKCSGLEIQQYSEEGITSIFSDSFRKIKCSKIDHKTPFDSNQNFIFCHFRRV